MPSHPRSSRTPVQRPVPTSLPTHTHLPPAARVVLFFCRALDRHVRSAATTSAATGFGLFLLGHPRGATLTSPRHTPGCLTGCRACAGRASHLGRENPAAVGVISGLLQRKRSGALSSIGTRQAWPRTASSGARERPICPTPRRWRSKMSRSSSFSSEGT